MDGEALDVRRRSRRIAKLPSRDVLYGQLVGIVASPITGLARGLNALLSGVAIALGQVQAKEEAGEIPAGRRRRRAGGCRRAEPAAEEAPAEEAAAEAPARRRPRLRRPPRPRLRPPRRPRRRPHRGARRRGRARRHDEASEAPAEGRRRQPLTTNEESE